MWRALSLSLSLALALGMLAAGCDLVFTIDVADAPPSTHDEDGDGLFDDVDNCPVTSNPPNTPGAPQDDLDGDGVGDVCDPHAATPGDSIAALEFFNGNFGDFWTPDINTWTAGSDTLTSPESPAAGADQHFLLRQSIQAKNATMEVGFTVLDFGPEGNKNEISIRLDADTDMAHCDLVEQQRDDRSELEIGTQGFSTGTQFMPEVPVGSSLRLRLTRNVPDEVCSVGSASTTLVNTDPTAVIMIPSVVLVDFQVRLDFIAIYQVQ